MAGQNTHENTLAAEIKETDNQTSDPRVLTDDVSNADKVILKPRAALTIMEVQSIVDASFGENGKRCYKVGWKESWVYDDHLHDCDELVAKFWSKQTSTANTNDLKERTNNVKVVLVGPQNKPRKNETMVDAGFKSGKETSENFCNESDKTRNRKRNTLVCHICKATFDMVTSIQHHYAEVHPGVKPFACSRCGKRFGRRENLNRHIRIHTGDRRYVCNYCGKGYTDPSGLKKHLIAKHTVREDYPCTICKSKTFKSRNKLNLHLEKHSLNEAGKRENSSNAFNNGTRTIKTPKEELIFSCPNDDTGDASNSANADATMDFHEDSGDLSREDRLEGAIDRSEKVVFILPDEHLGMSEQPFDEPNKTS